MDKQEAAKAISELLNKAEDAMIEATRISEASGVSFHLPWGGEGTHQRGMGASYYPKGHEEIDGDWTNEGWNPSAGTC